MALSGSITNNFRTGYQIRIDWTATQNVETNQSTITAKFYLKSLGSSYTISSTSAKTLHIVIDGTVYTHSVTVGLSGNQDKLLATSSKTVTHNSVGERSFTLDGDLGINVTLGGTYYGTIGFTATSFTLNTIPRASTLAITNSGLNLGTTLNMTITPASGSYTHKVYTDWYDGFWTLAQTLSAGTTSYGYATPLSWCARIPNSTSGNGRIKLETYSGTTKLGEVIGNFTALVPASIVPSASHTITPYDRLGTTYVQSKSYVGVATTAAGNQGSTIASYSSKVKQGTNIITQSSSANYTSAIIPYSGTITIETTVTDSRGRTAVASNDITVAAYAQPWITAFDAFRSTSGGTADPQGAYVKVTAAATIAAVCTTHLGAARYRKVGDADWTYAQTDSSDSTPAISVVFAADVNYSYEVQMVATDNYGSSVSQITVLTAFVLWDTHSSGQSMAFGKVAEGIGLLEVEGDVYLNQKVRLTQATTGHTIDSDDYPFKIGEDGGLNMVGDLGGFQARNNGAVSDLYLNSYGGDIITAGDIKIDGDRIAASGSNADGRYVKFYDGTMICWKTKVITSNISTAWNSYVYASGYLSLGSFAQTFTEVPNVQVTGNWGTTSSSFWCGALRNTTTSAAGDMEFYRGTSSTNVNMYITVLAVGRWY